MRMQVNLWVAEFIGYEMKKQPQKGINIKKWVNTSDYELKNTQRNE
jgi:hypothetical protein